MCIDVLPECMPEQHLSPKGIRSPGTEVKDDCLLPCEC